MTVLQHLEQLIALPSVNPAFIPVSDPNAGEHRVAEYLEAQARAAGLDIAFQQVSPGRRNVLIRLAPRGAVRQRVLLAPHMDTVGIADPRQLKPVRKGGRLYGRGACDTKGSLAAMFTALVEASALKARPVHTEITLAALVDEESSQSGSRHLARSGLKAGLAIVGEPTELRVVTAHKGDLWLELTTRGKAAHGSRPDLGINAIHRMATVVQLLETDYARQLRRRRHPLLGHPTINVGMIRGGRQPNIVPDECSIRVDRRTIPGEKDAAVKREILAFIRARGTAVQLNDAKADEPAPPMETPDKHPLAERFLSVCGQSRRAGVDFFTDAGVLSAAGIPCVVFGPGNIAQAHTTDEWVEIRQLNRATHLLRTFFMSLP